jgi:hypothetical protein
VRADVVQYWDEICGKAHVSLPILRVSRHSGLIKTTVSRKRPLRQ